MALKNAINRAEELCNKTGERQYVLRSSEGFLIIPASEFISDMTPVVVYCID